MKYSVLIPLVITMVIANMARAQSQDQLKQDQLKQMQTINPDLQPPIQLDSDLIHANSIQTTESKHLILLTDIKDNKKVDQFNAVFDAAVPQWAAYFEIHENLTRDWKLRGMIIADRNRFGRAKLIPKDLPNFLAGFQRGHEMWVYVQPGDYYTRHLLLHEGTHSFMQWFLGGTGAPWYTEGMAELIGAHRWKDGQLKIAHQFDDRSEAPYWGRIKLIQEDCANSKAMSLSDVFQISSTSFREVRYYAWSWAACHFLSQHPKSSAEFARLRAIASMSPQKFNQTFTKWIFGARAELERDWELFINEIEFGYDVERGSLANALKADNGKSFSIDAARGWQATDIQIEPGDDYAFKAKGNFVVAEKEAATWNCEPDGITLEYYRRHPLGQLMVGLLEGSGKISQQPIGSFARQKFNTAGILCFRINESPAKLGDNDGQLSVQFKKMNR